MKLGLLAVTASAAGLLSACSTYDVEGWNAAMDDYLGYYYPDQSYQETLYCGSGTGHITVYSGVRSNQGYAYILNNGPNHVEEISIKVSEVTEVYAMHLGVGQVTETAWFHPSRSAYYEWSC